MTNSTISSSSRNTISMLKHGDQVAMRWLV